MPMSPRLLRPRSTGFSPRNLSGLALWLDPTVASSLTISTGVQTWADLSGNGRNFTQSVGNNQPTLTTIGGKTALNFNGTSHHLLTTSTLFTGNSSFTFFQVFEGTFPGNGTALFTHRTGEGGADTNDITVGLSANNGSNWLFGTLRTRVSTSRSGAVANTDQRFDSVDASGIGAVSLVGTFSASPTSTAWFKGTAAPSSAGTSGLTSVNGMSLGCRNNATRDLFYVGKMGEIIAYDRILTTSERRRVESYLARKWGYTTLSAPIVSNADAQDWIERVYANGGTVSTSTAAAVNTFCNDIDAAGLRDRFYRLSLVAGSNLNAALVPLYRGRSRTGSQFGNTTDTNNGPFVSGDYAETGSSGGLKSGGATKFLNTGFKAPSASASPSDFHIGVYAQGVEAGGASRIFMGMATNQAGSNLTTGIGWVTSGAVSGVAINETTFLNGGATDRQGLLLAVNDGNRNTIYYDDGTSVATHSGALSSGFETGTGDEFYILARNFVGTTQLHSLNKRIRAYSIGLAMTSSQVTAFQTAMVTFQTALSRNV